MVIEAGAGKKKSGVCHVIVSSEYEDQRIDNYLLNKLKGMPKSRIYRLLRKGEVRVNGKRIGPSYRLQEGDDVRLPPMVLDEQAKKVPPAKATSELLAARIIYEDEDVLIINKPSGMSVHAGSTVRVGVIEALRHMYPAFPNLELAHRLDAETSGCLVLAKRKRVLREIHSLLREGEVTKIYWALTKGKWKRTELKVDVSLFKDYQDGGKHVVEVRRDGKEALSIFETLEDFDGAALMRVKLITGRTHQIRVHAQHRKHPVAGDDRYGDPVFNKEMKKLGLRRMFLHSRSIDFTLPSVNRRIKVEAPLDQDLDDVLNKLRGS